MTFNAMLIEKINNVVSCNLKTIAKKTLLEQAGDTLIKINYSTLNYKDALSLTNTAPIVRSWPMIPGIDGVGTVIECKAGAYEVGDQVILNGWGCGETHWGCFAQYAYIKSDRLVPLPAAFTEEQSMMIGTAGYTAALCVNRIRDFGIKPAHGKILMTGATGGVGSIAISLLSQLGYEVVAATSKVKDEAYLHQLGATEIIDSHVLKQPGKPLQKEAWAAAVDVLGSDTLANVCAQINYGGIVAACGLAQGMDFPASVAPFILRNITLAGVDSVMAPFAKRMAAWQLLSEHLDISKLGFIAKKVGLKEILPLAQQMIEGKIIGRFVIDLSDIDNL